MEDTKGRDRVDLPCAARYRDGPGVEERMPREEELTKETYLLKGGAEKSEMPMVAFVGGPQMPGLYLI